ncbi:MAG: sulfatase [Phycisphaerae bacterium]
MSQTPENKRPNMIWIFGDQHRAQALSCMADPNVNTPNIDRMADTGVHFTGAVAGMPLCCPFRGSLITSRYPHQCVPGHEYPLDDKLPTVATAFRDNGYHTGYFGKWHLDGWKEADGRAAMHIVPPHRRGGFDEWVGYDNNNSQYDCWVHGGEGDRAFHGRLPGYETDCLTDLLIDYIQRRTDACEQDTDEECKPFFAVLSVQPPHGPNVAPAEYMAMHNPGDVQFRPNVPPVERVQSQAARKLAGYYAQIENLDWNVGRVRQALQDAGIDDDTWIIFFSDHGDMMGSHGQFAKMTAHEESIRVPCVVNRGESHYNTRRGQSPAPMNHVDYAPTSLGLCGLEVPDWMQGRDFSGHVLKDKPTPEIGTAYLQSVIPTYHGNSVDRPWRGIVTEDGWKYVCFENQPWLLFNLNEDPYELANLAFNSRYWDMRDRLQDQLKQWISDTDDEFALPKKLGR